MNTIKTAVLAALLIAATVLVPAKAGAVECDQLTGGLGICLPRIGTDFDQWGVATVDAFTKINSSAVVLSTTNPFASSWIMTPRISGISTGAPGVRVSSAIYQDSGFYFLTRSSMSIEGPGGLGVTYGVGAGSFSATSFSSAPTFLAGDGHAGAPSFQRAADADSGIFFNGNDISFSVNGTTRATVGLSTGLCGGSGATTGQPCLRSSGTGSASDPQLQFVSDSDTGFGRSGSNRPFISAGAVVVASFTSVEAHILPESAVSSSFGAAGYSITASSNIKVGSGKGYCWEGLGCQFAPVSGSMGDVIAANSNSFNGAGTNQTFGSSITINGGVFGTINQSTWVWLNGGIFTQAVFSACLTGSSVTLRTDGVTPIEVWFNGTTSNNSTQESALSFLIDGGYMSPLNSTTGMTAPSPLSTQCQSSYFRAVFTSPSAGDHTFCLTGRTQGGVNYTVTGLTTKCPYASQNNTASQFGVRLAH